MQLTHPLPPLSWLAGFYFQEPMKHRYPAVELLNFSNERSAISAIFCATVNLKRVMTGQREGRYHIYLYLGLTMQKKYWLLEQENF
jgi:hypothetical protein